MKRWTSVILLAALSLPAGSQASDEFDWAALGEAFAGFIAAPTAERAAAVAALLPPGSRPAYPTTEGDQRVRRDLEVGTEAIQELVERGSLPAMRVAFALGALSDGDWAEWLSYIRGSGATFHPQEYLKGQIEYFAGRSQPCGTDVLFVHWELIGERQPVLEARIRALESVEDADLAAVKACSLALLRSELEARGDPPDDEEPLLLQTDGGTHERIPGADEDPGARPDLETVRSLLSARRADGLPASLGPISLRGFSFAREVELSPSVRVVVVACNRGGGLLAFDRAGRFLAAYRSMEILDLGLVELDGDEQFELITRQKDSSGTGLLVVQHNVYRYQNGQLQHLWAGLAYGHVKTGVTDEEAEGFLRVSKRGKNAEIRQLLRDRRSGEAREHLWRLEGGRFERVDSAPR